MNRIKRLLSYFNIAERVLWCVSVVLIVLSFCLFDRGSYLTLIASLIGITALILTAKGHPISQALMIAFCVLYAVISWSFHYWGEMITYLGMSLPMAVIALIGWLRHPFEGREREVKVNRIRGREYALLALLSIAVTVSFYWILKLTNTANLLVSTVSITTSFIAAYLLARRSPWFALEYALNDVVLIVLWTLASLEDPAYVSVVVCFAAFLANDLYSFLSWRRMERRQRAFAEREGLRDGEAE